MLAALLLMLFVFFNRLFFVTIHQEGYRPFSEIMMFQGAPATHYQQDHPFSFALFKFTTSPYGAILGTGFALGVYLGWANLILKSKRRALAALITFALGELSLGLLNIPFSAAGAFHHSGCGMPCNYQPIVEFVVLNFAGLPVILLVLKSVVVSETFPTISRSRCP